MCCSLVVDPLWFYVRENNKGRKRRLCQPLACVLVFWFFFRYARQHIPTVTLHKTRSDQENDRAPYSLCCLLFVAPCLSYVEEYEREQEKDGSLSLLLFDLEKGRASLFLHLCCSRIVPLFLRCKTKKTYKKTKGMPTLLLAPCLMVMLLLLLLRITSNTYTSNA